MNKEWSEKHKNIQTLLKRENTFAEGIRQLIDFRNELFTQVTYIVNGFPEYSFSKRPFANSDGYESKTLAYSIWHIFRIEDITAHLLIENDEQILFSKGYKEKIHADIITTGNELQGDFIEAFSEQLSIGSLYEYAKEVMHSTNEILRKLDYSELKRKFSSEDRDRLIKSGCVSPDELAVWLIDYWCSKDILGLIKMPFSRHWIMHIEAMQRIKNKLCRQARKGVDPIAYCGFSCNHCFLGQWCGSCRTEYNVCSFALCFEDKKCPNAACCKEKGLDGCYECEELEGCLKGFYAPPNDGAAAAKAQAMFIKKHGKRAFLKVHDSLHRQYDFEKTQEILGQDMNEGLEILEKAYTQDLP